MLVRNVESGSSIVLNMKEMRHNDLPNTNSSTFYLLIMFLIEVKLVFDVSKMYTFFRE